MSLLRAARNGDLDAMRQCLEQGYNVSFGDDEHAVALHYVSLFGHHHCIDLLLERGESVDVRCAYRCTPLHYASRSGRSECIELLLDRQADINAVDFYRATPLHYASMNGKHSCIQRLHSKLGIDAIYAEECISHWESVSEGHARSVALLIDRQANINACDAHGRTPLHYVAASGRHQCVDRLIAHKANVNAVDGYRNSPLHLAAMYGRHRCVLLLLDRQAEIDARNNDDTTPLLFASRYSDEELAPEEPPIEGVQELPMGRSCIEELVARRADINALDDQHLSALHHAATSGVHDRIEQLIELGADKTIKSVRALPLSHAAALASAMPKHSHTLRSF